jgi:hypothetical protein
MTFFWVVSLVGIFLGYLITKFDNRVLIFALFWPGIPFVIDKLCRLALKKNWVKDKNNIEINRRTGQVTFTRKRQRVTLPFDEFDVCMPAGTRPTGSHDYYLRFVHKYSDKWFQHPTGRNNAWEVEQDWEFWQQYMDISQPLPDIPKMEPFRDRDPVTAEWDKQHHRPKDYWKNLDMDKARDMQRRSRAAATAFPWGATREEAMASGWQPSGVGEGDWQKNQD